MDKYSAIPSMNHSGRLRAPALPELTLVLVMMYWNAWTSSRGFFQRFDDRLAR